MAADPRFGQWMAGMPASSFTDQRAFAERQELLRVANERIVRMHVTGERIADSETLRGAYLFLACNPPLRGALGSGGPACRAGSDQP